ncbi:MAG: hypothetical protein MJZ19_09810 [Paludibacteraceae bacterium]|nr:hypothetical protein [Paludibacteraceae bacterium]
MKINILLCDTFPGLLPDFIPSYVSMFEKLFLSVNSSFEFRVYNSFNNEFPKRICRNELYLITGSNNGVYEDIEWIKSLLEWIRNANARNGKIIGICFGHQAVAQALGGKVEKAECGWGFGERTSHIEGEGVAHFFPTNKIRLLYNHHDQVTQKPESARIIAYSDFCKYDILAYGSNIISFQGHPEYTVEYSKHLLEKHSNGEEASVRIKAKETLEHSDPQGITALRLALDWLKL